MINKYSHLHLLDLWLLLKHFHTRHRLHINKRGTKLVASEMKKIVKTDLMPNKNTMIKNNKFYKQGYDVLASRSLQIIVKDGKMSEVIKKISN